MNDPDQMKQQADQAARSGQFELARALYESALTERPDWVAVHNNLATVYRQLGNVAGAEQNFRKALTLDPKQVGALSNLGALLVEQGRLGEASQLLEQARNIAPGHAGVLYNLALLEIEKTDFAAAVPILEQSISLNPTYAEAHCNLGLALRKLEQFRASEQALRKAINLNPNLLEAYVNLTATLSNLSDMQGALEAGHRAVELSPRSAEAHYNLANAYNHVPDFEQALSHYEQALTLNPNHSKAQINKAKPLRSLGRVKEAVKALRQLVQMDSYAPQAHSNLVFKLQYDLDQTSESLFTEARTWDERYRERFGTSFLHPVNLDAGRRLRVAYLSPHLKQHPVGFFLEPVLLHHTNKESDVICYADMANGDEVSERLKSSGVTWHHVGGLSHETLANRLRQDQIDILVDLDGHTRRNRLPIFAGRAAPLQVTWAGYVGTTGLDAMDYLITDARQTVESDLSLMTELPVYMPGNYVTVMPFADTPDVGACPSAHTGHITFGCFNTLDKINETVIALWSQIMTAVPDSRLRMITFDLGDETVRQRITGLFEQYGVSSDRLDLKGKIPRTELLAAYNTIDIALDPFPYSGGLTTLECLWMGVPVITKRDGDRFASRHSVAHLTAVGLTECIADDAEDYVARAVALADDAARRGLLRSTLRESLRGSPACDGEAFTRSLEKAYRLMWQRHCAGEAPSPILETQLV